MKAQGLTFADSGMWARGACWTLDTSEFPSEGAASSSLRDVLEKGEIPPRYFLSPRACAGILVRASRRGRTLPTQLQHALESASQQKTTT